jgi:hypothetical protein
VDRSKRKQLKSFLLALGLVCTCAPAAFSAEKYDQEYAQAIEAYKKKDYPTASKLFWKSITDGNGTAAAWLYMAHSKAGEGDLPEARRMYKSVVDIYKNTPEATAAASFIKRIDDKTWHPGPPGGPAKPVANASAVVAAPAVGFRARIEVIAPRDSHPKVSAATISTIRLAVDRLPKSIYKILDAGGARVFIGPNIIDKWPNSLNDIKPGQKELTLAEEPGRTYGRDIHIYERSVTTQGSRELGEARGMTEIEANFLHEVGHALDDCLGVYSKDHDLQGRYRMDCEALGDDAKSALSYYLQPGDAGPAEACAESVCILLGGEHKEKDRFNRSFPRTEAWVKAKLKL